MHSKKILSMVIAGLFGTLVSGCNGGGSSSSSGASCSVGVAPAAPTESNEVQISAGCGANGVSATNVPFVSVTVYDEHGESQVIDHVLLDTGSSGFKVLKSQLNSSLTFSSVLQGNNTESPVYSCVTYGSGYMFGSNNYAGLQIGGQRANNVPIQIVNDTDRSIVPSSCSDLGNLADLMKTSGAKGILGVNPMTFESNSNVIMYTSNGGNYSLAIESAGPIPNLFVNPISAFTQHNNGAIISYPRVSNTANTGVYGTLTFGVGTALNNVIPVSVNMVTGESSYLGYFGSNENGWPVSGIFDSGTNTLGIGGYDIPTCANLSFCPSSPTTVTPSIYNYDGSGTRISLSVQLSSVEGLANYSILPYWGNRLLPSYGQAIYGMPFFYGKNVYLEFYDNSQPDSYPRWGFAIQ